MKGQEVAAPRKRNALAIGGTVHEKNCSGIGNEQTFSTTEVTGTSFQRRFGEFLMHWVAIVPSLETA